MDRDTISRQDIIQRLEYVIAHGVPNERGKHEMTAEAILEAVKQLPPAQLSTNLAEVGTDLISRQAAIDALRAMQTYKLFAGDDMLLIDQAGAQTELMMLPPAQPERIIHCKDCEWWTKQECSPQGRCALSGMYPTGGWFCGNARMREVTT